MMILFAWWGPAFLLLLGICVLLLTKGVGLKAVGALLTFLGGVMLALQLWIYLRHWHSG
ncbi:MAG: hypothetical protein LAO04_03195 [Acidobacteriia bacterium]|nr:hypothetical protein [Terriglobia bacterium]